MQLDQFFKIEFINANLLAKTKVQVLTELVNTLIHGGRNLNPSLIVETLQQRENLGSTGIGDGVAIPHGKTSAINDLILLKKVTEK